VNPLLIFTVIIVILSLSSCVLQAGAALGSSRSVSERSDPVCPT
jgi:hypothetical protein